MMQTINIMIVGVGGQGTLLTSRVLGKIALTGGYDVKLSEVHGMAQRGGSVVTFVRYGESVAEPIVEEGQADILIAFERLEALRYAHFLKKGGAIIVNDTRIDPMPVVIGAAEYPEHILEELSKKYGRTVMPVSCVELTEETITEILKNVLFEFPLKEIAFSMPKWVTMLDHGHWLQEAVYTAVQEFAAGASVMKDIASSPRTVECPYVKTSKMKFIDLGTGCATMALELQDDIFYKVLGETTGLEICDEASLMPCIINLARIKTQYEKIKSALDEVNATGYGIVMPGIDELTLEEPEIVHQGGRYGVRLRASAPSINMIRTEISTEVAPIVGSERQSEELVKSLLADFEEDPGKIWQSNIFGKSLHELVNEGLQNKLLHMPSEARTRLQETIERVINEGCSGLICIIL